MLKALLKAQVLKFLHKNFTYKPLDYDFGGKSQVFDRWVLFEGHLGTVRLHRLNCPEWPRVSHDHPWDFLAVVLRGGYCETVDGSPVHRWHGPGAIVRRKAREKHNVATLQHDRDSWSLVFTGNKYRDWKTEM